MRQKLAGLRQLRSIPLLAMTVLTVVLLALSMGQLVLPQPSQSSNPSRLTVQFGTGVPAASEMRITHDVHAGSDGAMDEAVTIYIAEGDGWATISDILVGWSGGPEEWNCNVFTTPNLESRSEEVPDFPASYEWASAGALGSRELAEVSESRLPNQPAPTLATVKRAEFVVSGRMRVSGIECARRAPIETLANAQVAVRPTVLLIGMPELDRVPIQVEYDRVSLNTPRAWALATGSVDHAEPQEAGESFVTYLGGTTAMGPLRDGMVFTIPERQQWINVSFASSTIALSALLGMGLQLWSDRPALRVELQRPPAVPRPVDRARTGARYMPRLRMLVTIVGAFLLGRALTRRDRRER